MKSCCSLLTAAGLTLLAGALAVGSPPPPGSVSHDLRVTLDPAGSRLSVVDRVEIPAAPGARTVHFLLHAGLAPRSRTQGATVRRLEGAPSPRDFFPAADGTSTGLPGGIPAEHFGVELPAGVNSFEIEYGGELHHPVTEAGEEYARGFGVTPGLVSPEGVFLSGSTLWVPWFGGGPVRFTLEARVPAGWEALSQGARTAHERSVSGSRSRWESPEPQDEVYLVAGPWTEYRRAAGGVEVQAFLRNPEPELANRYLDATGRYLEMYGKLIGPYPYKKFALVENFWETGYGMPSFTLLGPQIIRFPFILNTSYPHEILHNWWGNGVYVDYASGNWSEGLTAYLADHLLPEARGEGAEHRLTTLQKYADYAARAKDFPLSSFVSRHSAATEAVGYGKALFFFHMVRLRIGDEAFRRGLRKFYDDNRFRAARYEDLRRSFEAASGTSLADEFSQWVERAGAPALRLTGVQSQEAGGEHILSAVLEQVQEGEPYRLRVPVAVTLEGQGQAFQAFVAADGKRTEIALKLPARPLRVDVDPEFDLFRRLHTAETPPALSGLFGAEKALIVLPSTAPAAVLRAYRELAESWAEASPGKVEVTTDDPVAELPADRAVWVFGWENRLLPEVRRAAEGYDAELGEAGVRFGRVELPRSGHAAVAAARHPRNPELLVGWLAADVPEALPGLGRKLPHYHKWSYLVFEGREPTNVAKGRWPVVGSPLSVDLAKGLRLAERAKLAPRKALAELPPAFSREAMLDTIRALADEGLEGRALGKPGLDRAAQLVAERFRGAGLKPGGDGDSYFQSWTERVGEAEVGLRNVVGVLPGSKAEWAGQSVVLGAHYDGQGLGLPGGRSEDRGRVHPGADDNGSGVAVLVELAKAFRDKGLARTIVFVAFTGEEAGRLGSRRYVASERRYPADRAIGMVNLDTVGRLGRNKLLVLGSGSASEWVHIFNGAGYTAGVQVEVVSNDAGGSDQVSFLDGNVPAVQLFSGPHLDYHRPGDTPDRIDADGLIKVAAVAKEAVEYLASRPDPLTKAGVAGVTGARAGEGGARKVSLGTIPDFAHSGEGVRLSGVAPGSPAERAGLREGDVIVGLGTAPVKALGDFSAVLKSLKPGDVLTVRFRRGGEERKVEASVEAR